MLAHIIWVIKQGVRITNTKMPDKKVDYNNVMAFLQMRANDVAKEETVWKSVRKIDGRTQNEMAEELNVGIKKYRNIENGNAMKLMHRFYRNYMISLPFSIEYFYV